MKKIFAVVLAITLLASLSGVALAAEVKVKDLMVDGRGLYRTDAGDLMIDVTDCDADTVNELSIRFVASGNWELRETHVYVGTEPPSKSNPGKFGSKNEDLADDTTSSTHCIEFGDGIVPGETVWIAAHAEMIDESQVNPYNSDILYWEETAWAQDDDPLPNPESDYPIGAGKNWATCFQYTIPGP